MEYLVDTNIFFHVINSNVFGVAEFCKNKGNDICVTKTIIDELEPGYQREVVLCQDLVQIKMRSSAC